MADLPVIIFAPGGWHKASCFSRTQGLLEAAGYTVFGIDLPSIDSENAGIPPTQNWDEDVEAIRDSILRLLDEEHQNVVLAVHSYSGTIGSEAVKGLDRKARQEAGKSTSVQHLVYLAALAMEEGRWIWEFTNGKPDRVRIEVCYRSLLLEKPADRRRETSAMLWNRKTGSTTICRLMRLMSLWSSI
jgi:pimeloyl-ACP methyl ester carboxylesterase